jgi:hypothetical protein
MPAMSLFDAVIVLALIVFIVLLLRAAHVLGVNPDQQIKEQEDLAGPFPPGTTRTEKLRWMNIFGSVAVSSPKRVWAITIATVVFFLWLLVLQ